MINIDPSNPDWPALLKERLQIGQDVTLVGLDYSKDGLFCEILALSHGLLFRIDYQHRLGYFRRTSALGG